jgi:hypothetical protein
MPITIKELLLSDVISEVVEKVNFNFDQLVLAGGGPPGIQGIQGLAGPIGPIGARGDHWFVGSSAFGQTADHDGTGLQVQDLFLESDGDVYKYFEIGGSTGWTYSGINLKGPTGAQGVTGGGLEWSIYLGSTQGNAIGSYSYTPKIIGTSLDTDFLVPNATKDSIFLGSPSWAYNKLDNFGANIESPNSFIDRIKRMPKLSIIQSEVNTFGMNGLLFGAYGATTTRVSNSSYGSAGPTTSAFDFVNMGFATTDPQDLGDGTKYKTRFKLISPRASVRFEIGGIPGNALQGEKRVANFETVANQTSFKDWDSSKYINIEDSNFAATPIIASLREISIVSKNDISSTPGNTGIYSNLIPTSGATNKYGYIALQNDPGTNPNTSGWPEHDYGNVIIGPTKLGSVNLGFASPQGLAIVRKITKHDTVDAAIRFFQTAYLTGSPALTEEYKIKSTFVGAITPVRIIDSELSSLPLDTLALSSGLGYSIPGVTAAGRIGFTNNVLSTFKPQHPFHVSISKDAGTRNTGWDQGGIFNAGELDMFYAGFDNDPIIGSTGRNSGIGLASKSYLDLNNVAHSVPVIQTYYRVKPGMVNSIDNPYDNSNPSIGQGTSAPHLYMQPHNSSNIGIGFSPNPTIFNAGQNGYWPLAKVSINGGVVIGSTAQGYHNLLTNRPSNGILVETTIIVGATTIENQYSTSYATSGQVLNGNGIGYSNVSASFNQFVFGRFFLGKNSGTNGGFPEFGFSDFRTGIRLATTNVASPNNNTGVTGKGQLISAPNLTQSDNINAGNFAFPKIVAEWSSRGDSLRAAQTVTTAGGNFNVPAVDYTNNFEYSNLKITDTYSEEWNYREFYELSKKFSAFKVPTSNASIPTLFFPGIYHVIPTNKSGLFLNIDYLYENTVNTHYHYIEYDGAIKQRPIAAPGGKQLWYLNGSTTPASGNVATTLTDHRDQKRYFPPDINSVDYAQTPIFYGNLAGNNILSSKEFNRRWPTNFAMLEDGHYNGQKFTLTVLNADTQNNLYLDSTPPHPELLSDTYNGNWALRNNFTTVNSDDIRLKIKSKIIFPVGADSEYLAPGTPYGDWIPDNPTSVVNGNINQSSILGNKLGAVLQSWTVYNFIWQAGDFGLYNNMAFTTLNTIPYNNGGITFQTFNQADPINRTLSNTKVYEHAGVWICTGMTRLTPRTVFDYGSLNKINREFTDL